MPQPFEQLQPPIPHLGELASLASAFAWAGSTCIYRRFGVGLRSETLNLYKNLMAIGWMGVGALAIRPELPRDPGVYLWLGFSGVVGLALGDTAFFASLRRLGAQLTSALYCLVPPMSAAIAFLQLRETMTPIELAGMTVTLAAVAAVVFYRHRGAPRLDSFGARDAFAGVVYSVIAGAATAYCSVIMHEQMQKTHALPGTMMRMVPAIVLLIAMSSLRRARGGEPSTKPTRPQMLALGAAALVGSCIGLVFYSVGMKYAKAGVATSISATYPIWVIPIAAIFLKETVNWRAAAFTVVAVAGIALMFL